MKWSRNPERLATADNYRAYLNEVTDNPLHVADERRFYRTYYMRRFLPRPHWDILDFGSYLGSNCIHYALMGHAIEGVEGSAVCVEKAREELERFPGLDRKILFHHCLIEEFNPPHLFNAVICGEILEHVRDPQEVVDKAYDCLHPGGQLFVAVPAVQMEVHARSFTPDDLRILFEGCGFRVLQQLHEPRPQQVPGLPQHLCLGEKV